MLREIDRAGSQRDANDDAARAVRRSEPEPDRLTRFMAIRRMSESIAAPLSAEDASAQSMPDASPVKWHLAHASWFFEARVLQPHDARYRVYDERYAALFGAGADLHIACPRHARGLLTRPSLTEVLDYRRHVTLAVADALDAHRLGETALGLIERGMQQEQRRQELMLADIKHLLFQNPLRPAYRDVALSPGLERHLDWAAFAGGLQRIGHDGEGFCFDDELPQHAVLLSDFALANRPVSNAEYRGFVDDDAYRDSRLWQAQGWAVLQREGWRQPLYWSDDLQSEFTLHGDQPLDPHRPVSHLSYFEADAYARWAGSRLPTEFEWEHAARICGVTSGAGAAFGEDLHPVQAMRSRSDLFDAVWCWTSSAWRPYPGATRAVDANGQAPDEFTDEFSGDRQILRGGSFATPRGHLRLSYRHALPGAARWQFTGLRLARDAGPYRSIAPG